MLVEAVMVVVREVPIVVVAEVLGSENPWFVINDGTENLPMGVK